jgi:hypothetical protein
MGLLDDLPYGLLNLIRNGTQSRIPNGNFDAGDANGFPSQVPQQRLPLSFAGPDLTADITASSQGWPQRALSLSGSVGAPPTGNAPWSRGGRPADLLPMSPPAP